MKKKILFMILIVSVVVLGCTSRKKVFDADIQHENKEKVLSCKVRTVNENSELAITELYTFYFDSKEEKLIKYIQTMSFEYNSVNAINEYAEKNYTSGVEMCNEVKNLSGVYCSIKNNAETNLLVEFGVVLSEIDEGTELDTNLRNLKGASYNQLYEEFVINNSRNCETYFE